MFPKLEMNECKILNNFVSCGSGGGVASNWTFCWIFEIHSLREWKRRKFAVASRVTCLIAYSPELLYFSGWFWLFFCGRISTTLPHLKLISHLQHSSVSPCLLDLCAFLYVCIVCMSHGFKSFYNAVEYGLCMYVMNP